MEYSQKITAAHLKRKVVLYIRQSTMIQVYENVESTMRQYALTEKLVKLGWPLESIETVDCDLGQSGSGSCEREGFKQLVADVINDEVGAIACLETSRLARNSLEWGRLLQFCALTHTVLIDADGIYDLSDVNDRLLLGVKGTMSEFELHYIRSRMREGALHKAKRGKLRIPLPIGYVYDGADSVVKDPNMDVQSAVDMFFETFRICGSVGRVIRHYAKNGFKIPKDHSRGHGGKETSWVNLTLSKALAILHNPTYAGIYAYGRNQSVATINGTKFQLKPVNQWHVCLKDHHESYISEDEFNFNQAKLLSNSTRTSELPPVREGCALLQGIALCGVCGDAMTVRYQGSKDGNTPYYVCDNKARHYGGERCQGVHGTEIDKTVSNLILERLTPMAIENALKVKEELERRESYSDNYFVLQMERAQYEASLARKRFMNVDSSNRLVAFELEKIWNQKIAEAAKAEEELRNHERAKAKVAVQPDISELMSIPDNVRNIWNSEQINVKDRKRILRCLIEDVTITKNGRDIRLGVRFKTGSTVVLECQSPPVFFSTLATSGEALDIIQRESASHTIEDIVGILNKRGISSGSGMQFSVSGVRYLMRKHSIPSLKEHLISKGFLTGREKAAALNMTFGNFHKKRSAGLLDCDIIKTSGKGDYMFAP